MAEGLSGKRLYYREPPRGFQWWWLIWVAAGLCVFLCGAALGVVTLGGGGSVIGDFISPPFGGAQQVSLLIVGVDNSSAEGLADSIMVAVLSPESGDVSAVSVPRDSLVDVPGLGLTRINASHVKGGIDLTKQVVENLLGIHIDYYVELSTRGLVKLVDAIGGIDLNVEKRMKYNDRSQDLHINLQPGMQHLTGYQAMGYVRFRHDAVGDLGRMERQRQFMRAVAKKMLSPEHVASIPKVARVFLDTVKTNLSLRDVLALKHVMEECDPDAVRTETLPATPENLRGQSVLRLDLPQVRDVVDRVLLRQGITVSVLNATESEGLATRVANTLLGQGCQIVKVGNAAHRSDTTVVVDHRNQAHRAERIVEWLGKGVISMDPDGENPADVTVIVGRDMLNSLAARPPGP